MERARLLLRLRVVHADEEVRRRSSRRGMMRALRGAGKEAEGEGGEAGAEEDGATDTSSRGGRGWSALRRMYKRGALETLKWSIGALADANSNASSSNDAHAWADVLLFLQSGVEAKGMEAVLRHASRRAVCRVYGLKLFQALLSLYSTDTVRVVECCSCLHPQHTSLLTAPALYYHCFATPSSA